MTSVRIQAFVNLIWALADLVIVFTFLKFARAELPRFVTKSMFAAWGMLIFAASYVVQWLFLAEFWGARCFPLLGLSTKHTRCTARTSRADPHDCCCESGLGPSLQPFCLGDQRVALRSWPWHSLLCVRPGLSRVGRVVAKKSDELTKRRCPRPSVQVQFEGGSEENSHSGDFSSQKIAFTTPPSTRSAAPLVAEDDSPAI